MVHRAFGEHDTRSYIHASEHVCEQNNQFLYGMILLRSMTLVPDIRYLFLLAAGFFLVAEDAVFLVFFACAASAAFSVSFTRRAPLP